jgi:hypothetical protein
VEIVREGVVVAQGRGFALHAHLVAGSTLRLGHAPTDVLARGQSYTSAFKGCTLRFAGEDLGVFKVIHGGFMLFKTGEQEVVDFALCLGPAHIEDISRSAQFLRDLRLAKPSP